MKRRFALGCAFSVENLFDNFPFSKLKMTCRLAKEVNNDRHRNLAVCRVFRTCFKIIIDDIVERNVTFWFPTNGIIKCNMHMKRVRGIAFQRSRRVGKWADIDILKSNFSGYEIGLYMLGNRTPRVKTVYVDKPTKANISKHTNEGKQYGDGLIDTRITDYYEQVYALFPDFSKQDIKRILIFGFKSLYLHNSYGGDILIKTGSIWYYIGNLKYNSLQHFHYYIRKLSCKLRVLYRRKKIPWDGYYYFALTEEQYQNYISQKRTKGRPRKYFNIKNVMMYQILDDCKVSESSKKYIFRNPSISPVRLKYFVRDFVGNPELIEIRTPCKFKDILVNDNEYEFL